MARAHRVAPIALAIIALTCLSAAGKANAACNVCWQWSLTGSLTGYYKGTNCAVAKAAVATMLANLGQSQFMQDFGCNDGNKMWVCGSFASEQESAAFHAAISSIDPTYMVLSGVDQSFCQQQAGVTVTLKAYDWPGKQDADWAKNGRRVWNANQCFDADVDASFTCPTPRPQCNVCWKWSVASNPGYYKPDVCTSALTKLKGYLSTIGFGDFGQTSGCLNGDLWACGSFQTEADGKRFYDAFTAGAVADRDLALLGLAGSDFCAANPSAAVAVKSFEFKGAYDSTWGQNGVFTWEPVSGCATCSVDRSYTCPSKEEDAKAAAAQLPQPVCWKWTLENVTDSYYNGTVCTDALANLGKYLDSIGHSEFTSEAQCDGNSLWICGTFDNEPEAKIFYDDFTAMSNQVYDNNNNFALAGVDNQDFCSVFPGSTITIKSYQYKGKYDTAWGKKGKNSYTWDPVQNCPSCNVNYSFQCQQTAPQCNVCWKWELNDCKDNYYGGNTCSDTLGNLYYYLELIGHKQWTMDAKCDGNDMWICGTFANDDLGRLFKDAFTSGAKGYNNWALVGVYEKDFCRIFPGASISIKSYEYMGKYDDNWGKLKYTWEPVQHCDGCVVDYTYSCPEPEPPVECDVCWKWTLAGCKDNYYGGSKGGECKNALNKLQWFLESIGYGDWAHEARCDGNDLWICGTFTDQYVAKDFYDNFHAHVVGDIALMAVFDDGFCQDYPGSTVTIKSYAYPGKYDNAWGKNNKYTWQPTVDCQECDIDYTYTCPVPPPPCNVCWKWTLDGCEEEYYHGSQCNDALNKLRWYLESIGYSDFLKDAECDGNSMWICGTFDSDAIAKVFYDKFTKDLVGDNALAMAGVYSTDFCKLFPGVTININSYEYKGVYDKSWGSKGVDSYTWEPLQSCPSCDVHYTYTCPLPPPPCNTCWKWSLSGCKNNYYGGLNCNKALNQFKWYLSSIGYLDFAAEAKCDGNSLWVCGTFQNEGAAAKFYADLSASLANNSAIALSVVYDKDFCDLYPGAVITINSYAWANKYDTYWSSDGYKRQPVQACQSSSINYVYTCPVPPPPCYTCWKWTLTGCKDNYYGGDMCYRALGKLKFYLQSIGHEDFAEDAKCDGNTLWVCGTFANDTSAALFRSDFQRILTGANAMAMAGVYDDDFCTRYPGATVSVRNFESFGHDWNMDKYDNCWGNNCQPASIQSCPAGYVDYTYTCPTPQPPCNTCWRWTFSGCPLTNTYTNTPAVRGPAPSGKGPSSSYSKAVSSSGGSGGSGGSSSPGSYACNVALGTLRVNLQKIGYNDIAAASRCEGDTLWFCNTFTSNDVAWDFLDDFNFYYGKTNATIQAGIADSLFCQQYPGTTITVQSFEWFDPNQGNNQGQIGGKYDKTNTPAKYNTPASNCNGGNCKPVTIDTCPNGRITYTYTCPIPQPPCATCWRWTFSGLCKDRPHAPSPSKCPGGGCGGGSYPSGSKTPSGGYYPSGGKVPSGGYNPSGGKVPSGGYYPSGGKAPSGGKYPSGGKAPSGGKRPSGGGVTPYTTAAVAASAVAASAGDSYNTGNTINTGNDYYTAGEVCQMALTELRFYLTRINQTAYIEEFACDGDTLRVCGTFANNDEARRFFLLFQSNYLVVNAVAAAGVYDRDFCAENPGASVSLNNFEWLGKYANVWGPDCLRYRPVGQCAATAVNYQYTCPIPAPPCATCLRWTVTGCKLNYYGGDVCQDALKNLKFYMDKIGYGAFADQAKCQGNQIVVCGNFANNTMAATFFQSFIRTTTGVNATSVLGIYDTNFCAQNPGTVINLASFDSPNSYDYSWGADCYRYRQIGQCDATRTNITITCATPDPPCALCWKWSLAGCQNKKSPYGGDACTNYYGQSSMCNQALTNLRFYLDKIGWANFAANAKCSGNTLSLCGTFANNSMANKLYNDFTVNLVGPNALALIGVGDQTFCDQYPSSLITVRSSAYPGQIGYSWGPDCYRQRAIDQCTLGTVDYTATCPAPECNVCWKWSIYGSQDYYYGDQACFMAMAKLKDYLKAINQLDFAQEMKCDGNDLWVCGTFQSDTYAKMFYDAFFRNIVGVQGLGMLGTANDDFCDQYPGSIITVKSYDWGGKYDKTWGSGGQYDWEPTKDTCASCDVDYSFTCPSRPTIQACDVCWEWTITGAKSKSYYSTQKCNTALDQILNIVQTVDAQYKWIRTGFDDSTCGCSGNRIYVCGSFLSQDIGAQFLNILKASLTSSDQGFVAVPESNFCQYNPGALITLKSHGWDGGNSNAYASSSYKWPANKCPNCDLELQVKCDSSWTWKNWSNWTYKKR